MRIDKRKIVKEYIKLQKELEKKANKTRSNERKLVLEYIRLDIIPDEIDFWRDKYEVVKL